LFRRPSLPREHCLALRAGLLAGDEARAAFAEWRRSVDFDSTDAPTYRLLPLIYRNLGSGPRDDPVLGRMAGIYRRTWVLNTIQLREGERAIAVLTERGIPTLLLKGAAMIARWTDDPGVRMMSDIDLLVPRDRAPEAVERLAADGWRPAIDRSAPLSDADLDDEHAILLRSEGGSELDLHWRALIHGAGKASDDALWGRAEEVRLGGTGTRVLAAEDHVHHACSHATTWTATGRVDWIADSALIIRAAGASFDWSRVLELARLDRSEVPVRTLTGALGEVLGETVPANEIRKLRVRRPAIAERIEISLRRRRPHELGRAAEFFLALQDQRRQTRDLLRRPLIVAIPSFAREHWRVEGIRGVVAHLAYRALGRPRWLRRALLRRARPRDLVARDLAVLDGGSLDLRAEDVQRSLLGGWSFAEAGGRWTDGDEATLALRTPEPADDLAVEVTANPLLHPDHPELEVEIWANDRYVDTWAYRLGEAASSSRRFVLPRDSLVDNVLELAFVFRDPCRPMSLGVSDDPRRLGLFVRELRLSHA
jgi:Uncharacterised nucleotidyltransferase